MSPGTLCAYRGNFPAKGLEIIMTVLLHPTTILIPAGRERVAEIEIGIILSKLPPLNWRATSTSVNWLSRSRSTAEKAIARLGECSREGFD